ncbi:MAG: adenylate/guanylate cyclase domain-containing protein, partial [Candidatus Micrarchaeia archaeon]
FNGTEIELVEKLILATSFPQHPKDKLEYIICDADLDILGTERFFKRSMDLKKEIEENTGKKYTDIEWYKNQLELLQNHQHFTVSGRILRSEGEKINIEMLKKLIRK